MPNLEPQENFATMRIVQITDLHVSQEGKESFGVDVRANFLKIRDAIAALNPDHLVVSGDLCLNIGERPIYNWIKPYLDGLNIPYDIISGNHDDPVMMAEAFGIEELLSNKELYFQKKIGNKEILFLDTTTGVVSAEQLSWLKTRLAEMDCDVVIFMHHPPLYAGVPYMDSNHSLQNQEEVQKILFEFPHSITVFTGHYHVEKTITKKNITVHITPSCYFQIDQTSEAFKVDHHRIGFREILCQDDTIVSTVRYL